MMKVYAHRGASLELPENTLAAFSRAIDHGADGIELDCYRAADGSVVVIHDATLDRTTDATGPVTSRTAAELREVDAGNGEYVPTLDEVLALAAGRVRVNIEIKDPEAVDGVIAATDKLSDLNWFASSIHWDALAALRRRTGAEVYPVTIGTVESIEAMLARHADRLTEEQGERTFAWARDWQQALTWATEVGATGLSIGSRHLTPEIIAAIHDAGLEAWVWTVNDPVRAMELTAMGADAICTDAPAEVLAARSTRAA